MRIYPYLRASTKDQDATRAQERLAGFLEGKGVAASAWFTENASGAILKRPELMRLLEVAERGDVLLVEQVDRISRLNAEDWETLKTTIVGEGTKVVSLDLPTSHHFLQQKDEFTERMLSSINEMLLDMLAAIARKDYLDRRRMQQQGVQRAKEAGKYKGRKENKTLHNAIGGLLTSGQSYGEIVKALGCSRSTIAKVKKRQSPSA